MTASRQTATATATQLTYTQAVERLLWLGHEGRSLKWDLNNIRAVLERLGHSERQFAAVHIAGTNGKGSVAALVDSILRQANYRTGLYTSPHLEQVTERVRLDGRAVSGEDLGEWLVQVGAAAETALGGLPTYFELITAAAFHGFAAAEVDLAVVEVGMGGRFDATNVVQPALSIVTEIGLDHERYLGDSPAKIAAEKGDIVTTSASATAATRARRITSRRRTQAPSSAGARSK